MILNRRGFLRATGLAGLRAALGIELPETADISDFSGEAHIIPVDEPIAEGPITWDGGCIDLSSLRNVSIEVSRPIDMTYHWDDDLSRPVYRRPARWEASILAPKHRLDAIGLFPQELHDLMRAERLYRFAVPLREQRFEGLGILHYLRYDEGFAVGPRTVTMEIKGVGPLLDIYP